MDRIGFIGLGIMGKPMAGHLIKAGHPVCVYDIAKGPVEEFACSGRDRLREFQGSGGKVGPRIPHASRHAGRGSCPFRPGWGIGRD